MRVTGDGGTEGRELSGRSRDNKGHDGKRGVRVGATGLELRYEGHGVEVGRQRGDGPE